MFAWLPRIRCSCDTNQCIIFHPQGMTESIDPCQLSGKSIEICLQEPTHFKKASGDSSATEQHGNHKSRMQAIGSADEKHQAQLSALFRHKYLSNWDPVDSNSEPTASLGPLELNRFHITNTAKVSPSASLISGRSIHSWSSDCPST